MGRKRGYDAIEEGNFVRRNLKNKRGIGKGRSRVNTRRERSRVGNNATDVTERATVSHGLSGLGLDPLHLSLEAIASAKQSIGQVNLKGAWKGESISFAERKVKLHRGLVDPSRFGKKPSSKKIKSEYPDELLIELAPKCPGHCVEARLLTVSKAGANKGRKFYGCMYPADQRCDFFMWAEDNPALLNAMMSEAHSATAPMSWSDHAMAIYKKKISTFTLTELKALVRNINRRLEYTSVGKKLVLGGTKEELLERILVEERALLGANERLIGLHARDDPVESRGDVEDAVEDDASEGGGISLDDSEDNEMKGSVAEDEGDDLSLEDSDDESAEDDASASVSSAAATPIELLHRCFGFQDFRAAQKWAVDRCIRGQSSLLVMPTGAGKSLCYMVPALALPGLTIVVTPLIALMQDQMKKLPACLPGVCMSGDFAANEMAKLTASVLGGHIKVLYVSPERLCTNAFRALIANLHSRRTGDSSAISLLCVDEAHCMSSWSYNFRPAFLRIRREIQHIKPRATLALTATAPPYIRRDIMSHLQIPSDGLNSAPYSRKNIELKAVIALNEEHKRQAVLNLLREGASKVCADSAPRSSAVVNKVPSTIVYVWRRADADNLAEFIKACGINAIAYHAGMDSESRRKAQQSFDRGTSNVIVATTSFGMGVDKSDIRHVIHCCLPKSIESYLQESGRAGRDGDPARCHLLVTKDDFITQASLVHTSRLSKLQIFLMLQHCFSSLPRKSFALNMGQLERSLDISVVAIETMLSLLEMPPFCLLKIDSMSMDTVKGFLNPAKMTQFSGDVIIKALTKLNRSRESGLKSAAIENFQNGNFSGMGGFSSNSYGTGLSGFYGDIHATADGKPYKGIEVDVSIFAVMNETGLARDEVTRGLYALQKAAVIKEYNLSDDAVYATIVDDIAEIDVWATTAKLHQRLLEIEGLEAQRIVSIWKLGNIIASKTSLESSTSGLANDTQDAISALICEYMERQTKDSGEDESAPAVNGDDDNVLPPTFQSDQDENQKAILPFAEYLKRDIVMLQTDPKLADFGKELVQLWKKHSKVDTGINLSEEVLAMKALYICKLMHGLGTTRFPIATWKSNGAWSRYRHLEFASLIDYTLVYLRPTKLLKS